MRGAMTLAIVLVAAAGLPAGTATAPHLMNYQGVLRDAADNTLDGTFDMVFRFYDTDGGASCSGGVLLLTDSHLGAGSVKVTNGMFNAWLGGGTVTPGAEPDLGEVFRDQAAVYLEIKVRSEVLCPRIRILAAGYALNANNLSGYGQDYFLNTSSAEQTKSGDLGCVTGDQRGVFLNYKRTVFPGPNFEYYGVYAWGATAGGHFNNSAFTSEVSVGGEAYGIVAQGPVAGGYFEDNIGNSYVQVAADTVGINAYGRGKGGHFEDTSSNSRADVAAGNKGIEARGDEIGGHFYDMDMYGEAWLAYSPGDLGESYGVKARGATGGASFERSYWGGAADARALLAWQSDQGKLFGVYAKGQDVGVYARGEGAGSVGIHAEGVEVGGRFNTVEITGGADIAEPFIVSGSARVTAGTVVIIDEAIPGGLKISDRPYDSRVAGVISGAGGIRPGLTLAHESNKADEQHIAISGRVYCQATAANGAIRPGDLLTTAGVAGRAMKATDPQRSRGAILGKAMSALEADDGLVLVLVTLQ